MSNSYTYTTEDTGAIRRPKPVPNIISCHECDDNWCTGECVFVINDELDELINDPRHGTTGDYLSFGFGNQWFGVIARNGASHIRVA